MEKNMKQEISPVGSKIGEVYIPPKNGESGNRIGFIWEGDVFRSATNQEMTAHLAKETKHPLVNHLSRKKVKQFKVHFGVRYLGQPKTRY